MNAGYVYVMAFSNGTVKVGQTQNAGRRLSSHKSSARCFGLAVTGEWVSPLHAEWHANERALKEIAAGLGGTPVSLEYFSDIDFDVLVARARKLPFPATTVQEIDGKAIRRARIRRFLHQQDVAEQCVELGVRVDHSEVSRIENGHVKHPSQDVVRALAAVLELEPDEMFKAESDPDEDDDESEAA